MAPAEFQWDDGLSFAVAMLAGILFVIAFKAWTRTRTTRVLLFASAFGVFFLRGLLKPLVLVVGDIPAIDALEITADFTMLVLFFLGMTKE
jgi:predicted benzoate:H+ symporter BenE